VPGASLLRATGFLDDTRWHLLQMLAAERFFRQVSRSWMLRFQITAGLNTPGTRLRSNVFIDFYLDFDKLSNLR
jgi:hypothetical protein